MTAIHTKCFNIRTCYSKTTVAIYRHLFDESLLFKAMSMLPIYVHFISHSVRFCLVLKKKKVILHNFFLDVKFQTTRNEITRALILEFFGTFVWLSFLTKNEWSKESDCLMHWLFSVQWHQPKITQELIKIMSKNPSSHDSIWYATPRYDMVYDMIHVRTIRYDTIRCDKVTYTSRINMRVGFVRLYTTGRILT